MKMYKAFKKAIRCGDGVAIEQLYVDFLPIFQAAGKRTYVEIVLGMVDQYYSKIPAKLLHLIRCNRSLPIYKNVSKGGRPSAHWALDALIESIQRYYHNMGFANTLEGWNTHSANALLVYRSQNFAAKEYANVHSAEENDDRYINLKDTADKNRTKRTTEPKREAEWAAIEEVIILSQSTVEDPGRTSKDSLNLFWRVISKMKTKLADTATEENKDRWMEDTRTEEERVLSALTDMVMNDNEDRVNDDGTNIDEMFGNSEGVDNENDSDTDDEDEILPESLTGCNDKASNVYEDIVCGRKVGPIQKAGINYSSASDIIADGNKKLKNRNLVSSRLRKKARDQRRQKRLEKTLSETLDNNAEGDNNEEVMLNSTMIDPSLPTGINNVTYDIGMSFEYCCEEVFGRLPHEWQIQIGHCILDDVRRGRITSTLLVRPTGSGKSLVRDALGVCLGGIILTVVPLLSLGSDQCRKIQAKTKPNCRDIYTFHLDEMKDKGKLKQLCNSLTTLSTDRKKTIFIFVSPQSLLRQKIIETTVRNLVSLKLIRLVAFDEIHLFHHFGLSFRNEFNEIKDIIDGNKIPTLLMTATCTETIKKSVATMLQLKITHQFWPSCEGMRHRTVALNVSYSSRPFHNIWKKMQTTLMQNKKNKLIIYSNSLSKVRSFCRSCEKKLDEVGTEENKLHKIDVVELTGPLTVEQKAHHLANFMGEADEEYNPRILVATSGASNAGIDSDDVVGVFRLDMPPNEVDAVQERGRAGRFVGASSDTCFYNICISIESFEHKILQIMDPKELVICPNYRKEMENELMMSLRLLTISKTCIPQILEEHMSTNVDGQEQATLDCGNCFACNHSIHGKKFDREGIILVLFGLFQHGPNMVERPRSIDAVAKKITSTSDASQIIWGRKKTEPRDIKAALLILISAGILEYSCRYAPERQLELSLKVSKDGAPKFAYHDDESWLRIPTWYLRM